MLFVIGALEMFYDDDDDDDDGDKTPAHTIDVQSVTDGVSRQVTSD